MGPLVSTPNCRSGLFLVINHDSRVDTGLSKWTGLRVPPLALFVLVSGDDDGTDGTDRTALLGFEWSDSSACHGPFDCWWVLWRAPRDILFVAVVGLIATLPRWSFPSLRLKFK